MKKIFFLLIFVIFLGTFSIPAAAEDGISFAGVYTDEENVTVYMHGKDFSSCRIAGVEAKLGRISLVDSSEERIETLFLIDSSKSMLKYEEEISEFLLGCIDKKQNHEFYSIGVFDTGKAPKYLCEFDNNQYNLLKVVDKIKYDFKSSYIFDNLSSAIDTLRNNGENCYKRIILISDGAENSATGITIDDVIPVISEKYVQVITVTFADSGSKNFDELKNIARISRASDAPELVVEDKKSLDEAVNTVDKNKSDIYKIDLRLPEEVCDGGIKAVEISSDNGTATHDIRMPMINQIQVTTTVTTTEPPETTPEETEEEEPVPEEEDNGIIFGLSLSQLVIIGIILVVVVLVVVIIVLLTRKKSVKEEPPVMPAPSQDEGHTELHFNHVSAGDGDTVYLGDNGAETVSIILLDCENSGRIFERSFSEDIVVGRSANLSDIVIDYDNTVSKKHCRIYRIADSVWIENLSSSNPTLVNDKAVNAPRKLITSDIIKMGRLRFKVTIRID